MQELGPLGFILVYWMRVSLVILSIQLARKLRTPLFKALSAAIAGFFTLHLFLFVINNPTAGLFFWFSAGLLFAMYRLDFEPIHVLQEKAAYGAKPALRTVR